MKNRFLLIIILLSALHSFSQTIQLTNVSQDAFCGSGKDTMKFSVDYSGIPQNSNIVFYQSTNPAFNPYTGQGDSIGFINVGGSTSGGGQITTTCPEILGIFIDACNQSPLREENNEYMVITSGASGIQVSNLIVRLPNTNINTTPGNFTFVTPPASLITLLRTGTCTNTTLLPASNADFIPPNAIVIIFTLSGSGTPFYPYNFSSYCSTGQPIYILLNSNPSMTASFVNNAPVGGCTGQYRTTSITVGACTDQLTYSRCSLPEFNSADPNAGDGNYVIHLSTTDTSSTTNGGIQNNAADKCNGIVFDSIAGTKIIKFPIPNDGSNNPVTNFCNTGYHYIKAITNPNGSQPVSNEIQYKLVCLDVSTNVNALSICSGSNAVVNISSTDPNATFSWTVSGGAGITGAGAGSGNTINQALTYNGSTKDSVTYNITATDGICTKTTSVKAVVNKCNACAAFNLGNDTTYCGPFSRTLKSGNAATVWSTGVTADSITVTLPGTYTATCGSFIDSIKISQPRSIEFGTNTTSVCADSSINLDASTYYDSFHWNTGAITHSITVTTPGKYWVDVIKDGCKSNDTITVIQIAKLPKPILGRDTSFCGNFTYQLTTNVAQTQWFRNFVPLTIAPSITVNENTTGTYVAQVSNNCGSVYDTVIISNTSGINVNIGRDTAICVGNSLLLNATIAGNVTYNWSTGLHTPTISVNQPDKYWVDVFKNGCKATDTILVGSLNKEPKPDLGRDSVYCSNFSRILSTNNTQTKWFKNLSTTPFTTAGSVTVDQNSPGTYIAQISNSCGTVSDTVVISVAGALNINLGRDTVICNGSSLILKATVPGSNITYNWNTLETTSTISVNQFGKYWVDVSNGTCTVSDSILVDILDKPTIVSLGNDTSICGDFSLDLFTGDAGTIWNTNNVVGPKLTVTQAGTYIAENKNKCGSIKDTIVVQKFSIPSVKLRSDTTICDSLILSVGNGNYVSILWNTGDTIPSIVITSTGVYSVKVSNANCTNSDSVRIRKECFYDVYIPTAFSPNGDAINDVFIPMSDIKGMQVIDFVVFDRWGEKVFESKDFAPTYIVGNTPTDPSKGWNGIYKGQPAQVDNYVYFFTAKMPDDEVKIYKGTFALLR